MILDEKLKRLHVGVKAGGSLITHRPVFSNDAKSLYLVSDNIIYVYSTKTGINIGQIQSPNPETIANIAVIPSSDSTSNEIEEGTDELIIFTITGQLAHLNYNAAKNDTTLISSQNINLSLPKTWSKMLEWINILCVARNKFLVLGRVEQGDEVMLYYVHRRLPSSFENRNKNYSFYEFDKICWNVQPTLHSVCYGAEGQLVGATQDDSVFVMDYENRVSKWHKSGTRKFTCVAAHPNEWIIATGDDSGRILLWNNLFEKSPAKTVFHWHTLPTTDLCFTVEGTQMLSGGGECTLVKWDVTNADNKRTLPRMGLPVRHISVSGDNSLFAISHADNSIQLVNCVNEVEISIQNLTQCYLPEGTKLAGAASKCFKAGINFDPRTNGLVMNGKPGHLQCYSFRDDKHLFSLDITQQNFITAERHKAIQNTDIAHVAFSNNGKWLATGETLVNPEQEDRCLEVRLKFWEFDKEKQKYILNTSVDWPHEKGLQCLKIQGIDDEDLSLLTATSGNDKMFKTWGIINDGSTLHDKSYWWNCENVGSYRNLEAGPLAFSKDGSVIAAAFSHTLALWTCDHHEFKGSLSHAKLHEDIRMIEFGCHLSSHLVICCSKKNVIVWDVISMSLNWTVPLEVESIAVDPLTNIAAVFSTKRHVFFFRPETPRPLAIHKNISRSTVLSSVFVPNTSNYEFNNLRSTLVFINASQELCAFLPRDNKRKLIPKTPSKYPTIESTLTPFAQLTPEKSIKEIDYTKKNENLGGLYSLGIQGSNVVKEILEASPHTMPSVTYFCDQLLSAVSIPKALSDDTTEMENHVKRTYQRKKELGMSRTATDDTDDESDEVQEDSDQETLTKQRYVENVHVKEEEANKSNNMKPDASFYNIEQIATENTEWIESIFAKTKLN